MLLQSGVIRTDAGRTRNLNGQNRSPRPASLLDQGPTGCSHFTRESGSIKTTASGRSWLAAALCVRLRVPAHKTKGAATGAARRGNGLPPASPSSPRRVPRRARWESRGGGICTTASAWRPPMR